jgi:hypothetical protein
VSKTKLLTSLALVVGLVALAAFGGGWKWTIARGGSLPGTHAVRAHA